jgi:hypothetical protein
VTVICALVVAACTTPAVGPGSSVAPSPAAPASVSGSSPLPTPAASPASATTERLSSDVAVSSRDLSRPILPPMLGPLANLDPPPVLAGPFSIELFRKGDFASQATKAYCVPAAIQTMVNIMSPGASRSRAAQDRFYRLARRYSTDRLVGVGAEPEGWATVLEREGFGDFEVLAHRSRGGAIEVAAKALRMTGRPVGLLVWRGAHAWVMSGFRATADPAVTDDFRVTYVDVEDVWYPRVSSIWGASRRPGARVAVDRLSEDYLRWRRPTVRYPEKDGRYVLIVPVPSPA